MSFTWSNMFAKFMFVKFFPPMDKFVVLHAPTLRLLKNQNQNRIDYGLLHWLDFYFL